MLNSLVKHLKPKTAKKAKKDPKPKKEKKEKKEKKVKGQKQQQHQIVNVNVNTGSGNGKQSNNHGPQPQSVSQMLYNPALVTPQYNYESRPAVNPPTGDQLDIENVWKTINDAINKNSNKPGSGIQVPTITPPPVIQPPVVTPPPQITPPIVQPPAATPSPQITPPAATPSPQITPENVKPTPTPTNIPNPSKPTDPAMVDELKIDHLGFEIQDKYDGLAKKGKPTHIPFSKVVSAALLGGSVGAGLVYAGPEQIGHMALNTAISGAAAYVGNELGGVGGAAVGGLLASAVTAKIMHNRTIAQREEAERIQAERPPPIEVAQRNPAFTGVGRPLIDTAPSLLTKYKNAIFNTPNRVSPQDEQVWRIKRQQRLIKRNQGAYQPVGDVDPDELDLGFDPDVAYDVPSSAHVPPPIEQRDFGEILQEVRKPPQFLGTYAILNSPDRSPEQAIRLPPPPPPPGARSPQRLITLEDEEDLSTAYNLLVFLPGTPQLRRPISSTVPPITPIQHILTKEQEIFDNFLHTFKTFVSTYNGL